MNSHMTGPMARLLVFVAALAVCVPLAAAQVLRDPTRPAFFSGRPGEGGMVSRCHDAEWVLQSVLLSSQRRYSIINGKV